MEISHPPQVHRILLADDHALVRAGIRNALQDQSNWLIVGEIADGNELFSTLKHIPADLLMIDVTMPDFEPFSAIQAIKRLYPMLKILVVSAHDDDLYVQGLLATGVNGYHLKDQSLRDMVLAVEQVLAGKRWLSSRLLDKLLQANNSARPEESELPQLSNRQIDMLQLLNQGLDNRAIATRLDVSIKTVENHLTRLYRILGVQSRLEAVHYLTQNPKVLQYHQDGHTSPANVTAYTLPQRTSAVLIVDDNAHYRDQLSRLISRNFPVLQILEAGDSQSALFKADQPNLSLALIDVVLGEENGIQLVRRMKAQHPTLRIILMSAYPDREFHRQGLQAGASAFLDKKDLSPERLRHILSDLLAT